MIMAATMTTIKEGRNKEGKEGERKKTLKRKERKGERKNEIKKDGKKITKVCES